jgi:hypothetical protein
MHPLLADDAWKVGSNVPKEHGLRCGKTVEESSRLEISDAKPHIGRGNYAFRKPLPSVDPIERRDEHQALSLV